jgi:hypothetical protein
MTSKFVRSRDVSLNSSMRKTLHLLIFMDTSQRLRRPISECEHNEAVGGAFQEWQLQCERESRSRQPWTAVSSTLTAISWRWLSWRPECPDNASPMSVWRPWSTFQSLAGLSYHTRRIVRTWRLLYSVFSGRWKMDYAGNIFLRVTQSSQLWESQCRFLRARRDAGFCSSLANMLSQWWWLWNDSVLETESWLYPTTLLCAIYLLLFPWK